ncbi:MAG: tRNA (guanine-N(1)-)-methyltransferase [Parcubacteria group bacterium GW2011_GWF2_38_76]|nr:MAG: tRNA (guanine-N(1)-)-methyltransferase [Parcubacteria group bacterium GW2011_GWF2_38_76]HBM45910.1 tRNA (guanosine(37)-N1)-methyltransferase TrmD [Patescibacteria group bacterium]
MKTFSIITLFPEMFSSYLNESILKRAQEKKLIKFKIYNPRDFTTDKHHKADDRPYGGGPGMVMYAEPILKAVAKACLPVGRAKGTNKAKIFILSPRGKQFTNEVAKNIADKNENVILICGRYEGIDSRVKKILKAEEISVGPFIVTGGELPAMIMIDSISRQMEGVLGKFDSLEESRVSTGEMYTRPEVLKYKGKNYKVPKILLSGDHGKIEKFKLAKTDKKS